MERGALEEGGTGMGTALELHTTGSLVEERDMPGLVGGGYWSVSIACERWNILKIFIYMYMYKICRVWQ